MDIFAFEVNFDVDHHWSNH